MSKLNMDQMSMLKLIGRTAPDIEGWRPVSQILCAFFVDGYPHKPPAELFEFEKLENGGRVRLTETGETVLQYS